MNKPSFVYVTYIATTQEKLWNALLDPEITRQYWSNHRNKSDWKVGSTWQHEDYDDANEIDIIGKVLESDPPQRLVLSWADPDDASDPEKYSQVTFELKAAGSVMQLTVKHENLEPDSGMLRGISFGWPVVLSGLKTLLETQSTLPTDDVINCRAQFV